MYSNITNFNLDKLNTSVNLHNTRLKSPVQVCTLWIIWTILIKLRIKKCLHCHKSTPPHIFFNVAKFSCKYLTQSHCHNILKCIFTDRHRWKSNKPIEENCNLNSKVGTLVYIVYYTLPIFNFTVTAGIKEFSCSNKQRVIP